MRLSLKALKLAFLVNSLLLAHASAFPTWKHCLQLVISAKYRKEVAEKKKFDEKASQVDVSVVTVPFSTSLEWISYSLLYQAANRPLGSSLKRPGIAYLIELRDSEGTRLNLRAPHGIEQVYYDSWHWSGASYIAGTLREQIRVIEEKGGSRESVAQVRVLVARTAGGEQEERSREMLVRSIEIAQRLGLSSSFQIDVVQMQSVEASPGELGAKLLPFYLTPVSRYEKISNHLSDSKIPPGTMDLGEEGRILKPFPLPDGIIANTRTGKEFSVIPTDVDGKPVFAVKEDEGFCFGFEWNRPAVKMTKYTLSH